MKSGERGIIEKDGDEVKMNRKRITRIELKSAIWLRCFANDICNLKDYRRHGAHREDREELRQST
jgi:hypothetical protein